VLTSPLARHHHQRDAQRLGVHSCAGQGLARMETHALLSAMTKAVARIEIAGPVVRAANNLISGWERLPVRVVPDN
jgi:cytochrome P450